MFFAKTAGAFQSVVSTLMLTGVIVLGVVMTVLISRILSKTLLRGLPSAFHLELPPYRRRR
jgi:ferrous iron transport protein B